MKKRLYIGFVAAFISAILFGGTPILAKMAYAGGTNGVTLSFLRSALAAPILLTVLLIRKTSFRLSLKEIRDLALTGLFGTGSTTLLLYISYDYISIGVATSLHFLYPVLIMAVGIIFLKEKATIIRIFAAVLGFLGVAMLSGLQAISNPLGIALAILSAATYAFYMIFIQTSSLKNMDYFKLGFYFAIVNALVAGVFGLFTNELDFTMTPSAWLYSFIVAVLVCVVAVILLNYSIVKIGAISASMLSVSEPITGVVLGVIILNEQLSTSNIIGFVAVTISVLLVSISGITDNKTAKIAR